MERAAVRPAGESGNRAVARSPGAKSRRRNGTVLSPGRRDGFTPLLAGRLALGVAVGRSIARRSEGLPRQGGSSGGSLLPECTCWVLARTRLGSALLGSARAGGAEHLCCGWG